jgi:AcrR family transcriptional regulator
MARDSTETRRRLFQAATDEFTTHGIAGARVDRIAAAADANKQLIYAYFGNKRQLFEAVVTEHVTRFLEEVPFDAADLPGHAAAMFDFYVEHPEIAHLGTWHALEPGEAEHPIPVIQDAVRKRSRQIARAQRAGVVDSSLRPADLLALIGSISRTWAVATPELGAEKVDRRRLAARRKAVREATRRLVNGHR